MSSNRSPHVLRVLLPLGLLALSLALVACATTRQSPGVERSGFLGDYSQLREGGKDEAQLVYIKPAAGWSYYDAIMIDSVTIWRDEQGRML